MAPKAKTMISGANMTAQPRMLGCRVIGSRKMDSMAGEVPMPQAAPAVTSRPTDMVA